MGWYFILDSPLLLLLRSPPWRMRSCIEEINYEDSKEKASFLSLAIVYNTQKYVSENCGRNNWEWDRCDLMCNANNKIFEKKVKLRKRKKYMKWQEKEVRRIIRNKLLLFLLIILFLLSRYVESISCILNFK